MSAPPSYSKLPAPAYQQSPLRVCCIALNSVNKIRLIGVPSSVIPHIRKGITSTWGRIYTEKEYGGAHQIKIEGEPWVGYGSDHVPARRLIVAIIKAMTTQGWNLVQSADVSKLEHDLDTLFFESVDESLMGEMAEADLFSISFGSSNVLRVIDASPNVGNVVLQAIKTQWKFGVQDCATNVPKNVREFRINGTPWYPSQGEDIRTRMMLAQLMANLRALGYKLYTSVDISSGVGRDGRDIDTWVFRRVGNAWS
ncbi:hypothetical protein FBU30_010648 [Linnemannia zychae]|nr:hypothetical protein FBU30_010648 [Linnemannia zychae]